MYLTNPAAGTGRAVMHYTVMVENGERHNDPTDPLKPQPVDGLVVVKGPPDFAITLTADAAEISGLRLLDAAEKARRRPC